MEPIEYEKLFEYETSYWWYRGLRAILVDTIRRLPLGPSTRLLDAGCGTGKNLEALAKDVTCHLFGLELSLQAASYWRRNGLSRGCLASVNALPFKGASFDVVMTVDVLCCSEVEEVKAVNELWRLVRKGGYLIVIVPAYQWLLSEHDRAVHSVRRYTRQRLLALLEREPARIVRTTYLFPLFFPLIAGYRFLKKWTGSDGAGSPRSDLRRLPVFLNALFSVISLAEGRLLRTIDFPFGSSVLLVIEKVG